MIQASYSELVRKISEYSGLSISEVEKRVNEKKSRLSDLISHEGAAQIVASELGVSFDNQKSKIGGLLVGMRKVSVAGKILRISPVREFKTKNGVDSKVVNLTVSDDTGIVRGVLWDLNLVKMIEEGKVREGDTVDIKNASVRQGINGKELHLGSFSGLSISGEVISNAVDFSSVKSQQIAEKKKISELKENDIALVRAFVVQAFEPRIFNVCPECKKKVINDAERFVCQTHGNIIPKERHLMNLVLDDGSGNIRAVCFTDALMRIFGVGEEEINSVGMKKNELLGKEMIFSGRARKNKVFDSLEFTVNAADDSDPEKLIKEFEKK